MKYGKYEYERSFIVSKDLALRKVSEVKSITDTYLHGIGLRLRKVVVNGEPRYKLTQKKEIDPPRVGVKTITTIYLSGGEYEELLCLPGYRVEKVRHILNVNKQRIGVDVVRFGAEEICIAEVEFETEAKMNAYILPFNFVKEVTGDTFYSGFSIAKRFVEINK